MKEQQDQKATKDGTNLFEGIGSEYSVYRPDYPRELGEAFANLVKNKRRALDVGCGTGQITTILSEYFDQVVGIDSSESQLTHAVKRTNIRYFREAAEKTSLDDSSVDLIVAGQAVHWFDLACFYKEARRVAAPDAAIVLVSYGVPYIESAVNSVFQQGYWQSIHPYWPSARKQVENGYIDLDFPFEEIVFPDYFIQKNLSFDDMIGYIRTWSAYKKAKEKGELKAFEAFFERMKKSWGNPVNAKKVTWPISVRAGRVHRNSPP